MANDQGRSAVGKECSEESPLTRRQLLRAAAGVGGGLLVSGLTGCAEGPQRLPDAGTTGTGEASSASGGSAADSSTAASEIVHFTQPAVRRSKHGVLDTKTPCCFRPKFTEWKTSSSKPIV